MFRVLSISVARNEDADYEAKWEANITYAPGGAVLRTTAWRNTAVGALLAAAQRSWTTALRVGRRNLKAE